MLEIIISMALIAIISVGVYNSYITIIKTTKSGEKKQVALLAGKKIIEEIKECSNSGNIKYTDNIIKLEEHLELIDLTGNNDEYTGSENLGAGGDYYDRRDYKYKAVINLTKNDLSLSNNAKIGYLYDVTVTISDESGNELFKEMCNQTINMN